MGCTLECSGCSEAGNCQIFFENFVLPDLVKEEQEREYFEELMREEANV